ncbi:MAG: acyl-CoA synthetase [Rhodospirillales bacterium]|nr:acyl-CoA synthetase [Rhodospirillales bacterium]MBO6788243.1 acyl-CoA synthetase [Rhodospirillales bacterium]
MSETSSDGNIYEQGLDKNEANFKPLTPLSYLDWAARVFPNKTAVIHGPHRFTWAEFDERCRRLASALQKRGIGIGDTVSVMSPNAPAMLEAHYGVPMSGAVLNALNFRLDAETIAFILAHAETKILITDREFSDVIHEAIGILDNPDLIVVDIDDPLAKGGRLIGSMTYEDLLAEGDAGHVWQPPADEWQAICLNYTSGTTGNPKGVVYHHRGAYLNTMSNALVFRLGPESVYLWTLPMFHCNGWTYTWAVTAVGGTHVCLREVDPALIFPLIEEHRVTHMCGAPIVLNMLVHAPADVKRSFDHTIEVATGGAAPPSTVISRMESMGFNVTHMYGLTETYGPSTICVFQDDWADMPLEEKAAKMARQGVRTPGQFHQTVRDPETMELVPEDGETIGEIMFQSNTVMRGYLKNPSASAEAFRGGWYHTGDLAVQHADGYIEVKDRSKDIIISGGENISSLEVEECLYKHPGVMDCAVVAMPSEKWGETPLAFVTPTAEAEGVLTAEELIDYCKEHMARFKAPTRVEFGALPKTSTGKIQKFVLRERAQNELRETAAELAEEKDD